MQPIEYLDNFVKKFAIYWLIALVLGAIAGLVMSGNMQPSYQGIVTVNFTSKPTLNQASTPFYLYDNYYGLLASNQEKTNYLQWLNEPAIVQSIYNKAQISLPKESASSLSKTFVVLSNELANSATITVSRSSESESNRMIQAVKDVSQNFTDNSNDMVFLDASTQSIKPSKFLVTTGVALAFFVIAFIFSLVIDLFANRPRKS